MADHRELTAVERVIRNIIKLALLGLLLPATAIVWLLVLRPAQGQFELVLSVARPLVDANGQAEGAAPGCCTSREKDVISVETLEELVDRREAGHRFTLALDEQQVNERLLAYLADHPGSGLSETRVELLENEAVLRGKASIGSLLVDVKARGAVSIVNRRPELSINDLDVTGIPVPGFLKRKAIDSLMERVDLSPEKTGIHVDELEIHAGQVIIRGETA